MRIFQVSKVYYLAFLFISIFSCVGQNQSKSDLNKKDIASTKKITLQKMKHLDFDKGIYCGFLDSKNILWFGSVGSGLYRYDGASFTHFTEQDGLCDNQVCSIMEDKAGNLWLGTAKGLCRYDRGQFTTIAIPQRDTSSVWLDKVYPIVNPNQVMSILEDDDGTFWIATNGGGAYHYDGKTFTPYLHDIGSTQVDGLYHNTIQNLLKDQDGNIWFPSMIHGGVSRYDGEHFTQFMPKDGLARDMVRMAIQDRAGDIYFGTLHRGFSRYDGKTFTNFDASDGLCNNNVRCIYEAVDGRLWFGSGIGETCIYDGQSFTSFKTKEGRSIDKILCIVEDADNNIWLGGRSGLWKFDGEVVIDMTQ